MLKSLCLAGMVSASQAICGSHPALAQPHPFFPGNYRLDDDCNRFWHPQRFFSSPRNAPKPALVQSLKVNATWVEIASSWRVLRQAIAGYTFFDPAIDAHRLVNAEDWGKPKADEDGKLYFPALPWTVYGEQTINNFFTLVSYVRGQGVDAEISPDGCKGTV